MGGCHIWCKHKEIKTYRCYFLCSVVLQYIFFYFCCLNERNIVVLIFHHQRPLDFLPLCVKQVDAAYFLFFFLLLFLSSGFCMLFLHTHTHTRSPDPRSVAAASVSCFCGPHRNRWGWGADAKVALLALCIAPKMLHCAAGIMDATSKLMDRYTMAPRPARSERFSQSFYL